MTTDLSDKILMTATFDRIIDAGEGQRIAREMEVALRKIDPKARLSATWLDVQPGQTTVHMAFGPSGTLSDALMPIPPEQWPEPGEVMSITVRDGSSAS